MTTKEEILKEMPLLKEHENRFIVNYVIDKLIKGEKVNIVLQNIVLLYLKNEENLKNVLNQQTEKN